MAHNIWTDKAGKAHAAFAIEAAWHKLGVVLPNLMTAKEAMKAAGLDWEVEKRLLIHARVEKAEKRTLCSTP